MLTLKQLRQFCMTLPGATENIQWGDDRVFKIGDKMFACSGLEKDSRYSFKVEDDRFLELTDLEGVFPAPYLARAKWIQIEPQRCKLPKKDILALVKKSHELVLTKLTKKKQREILGSD